MAALTADRNTKRMGALMSDSPNKAPIKGTTTIYSGSGCVRNAAGYAVAATAATGLKTLGIARRGYDNSTGADAAILGEFDHGDFVMDNSGTDAITEAEVGALCYWEDDHTVCKTSTGKSVAGRVVDLNPTGATGVVVRLATGHVA